jgi:hypothetical protein
VPFGERPMFDIVAGCALTHNVPEEFWRAWLEQNKHSAVVKESLIFAYEKVESVRDKAKDGAKLMSGLQPLVPDTDSRIPKRIKNARDPANDKEMAA